MSPAFNAEQMPNEGNAMAEEEKGPFTITENELSYTKMPELLSTFNDEAQVNRLEEMLEFMKSEVERGKEHLKKLLEERIKLRKKY